MTECDSNGGNGEKWDGRELSSLESQQDLVVAWRAGEQERDVKIEG